MVHKRESTRILMLARSPYANANMHTCSCAFTKERLKGVEWHTHGGQLTGPSFRYTGPTQRHRCVNAKHKHAHF